jgi:hypothetical protein
MNKKDKNEAGKGNFDMHKVFITCTFVCSYMVIDYFKFKIFISKYRNSKKTLVRVRFGLGLG